MKFSFFPSFYKGFLPIWILPILIYLALSNILYLFNDSTRFGAAVDLRPLYCAANLWLKKENPYDDSKIKSEWQKIPANQKGNLMQSPGFPFFPMVYPPNAIPLFTPLTLLPWKYAAYTWYCLNILFLIGMVYFLGGWIGEGLHWGIYYEITLLLLAFKGTVVGFSTGQPAFLCLFAGFGSLYFQQRGKFYISAILLGICSFKISLAIPFILFFLIKNNYKVLLVSFIIPLILFSITAIYSPIDLVSVYADTLKTFRELVYTSPHNIYRDRLTEFGVLVKGLSWGSWRQISLIYVVFIFVTVGLLKFYTFGKSLDEKYIFVLLALAGFCTIHHTYYDMMILVPIICFFDKFSGMWKWLFYLLLLRLMIPFNILLYKYKVSSELFYYSLPITILLLFILFLKLLFQKVDSNSLCLSK